MKKRNIIFVATVLSIICIFSFCFAGCASKNIEGLFNKDFVMPTASEVNEIASLNGYKLTSSIYGAMAIFEKDGKQSLYSFKNNEFIIQNKIIEREGQFFYVQKSNDPTKVEVYSHNGIALTCTLDDILYSSIKLDNMIYSYDKEANLVGKEMKKDFIPQGNAYAFEMKDIIAEVYILDEDTYLIINDKETNQYMHTICLNDYVVNEITNMGVLSNGCLVLQEEIPLPDNENVYDYRVGKDKFDLNTQIINLKKATSKKIDIDFIITQIVSNAFSEDEDILAEGVNIVEYTEIMDKQLTSRSRIQIMDNNLKIKIDLQKILPGAKDFGFMYDGGLYFSSDSEVLNYKNKDRNFRYSKFSIDSTESGFIISETSIYDEYGKKIIDKTKYKDFNIKKILETGIVIFTYSESIGHTVTKAVDRNGNEKSFGENANIQTRSSSFSYIDKNGNLTLYEEDLNKPINATAIKASEYHTDSYTIGKKVYNIYSIGDKTFSRTISF